MNKLRLFLTITMISGACSYAGFTLAESTVVTSQGTFKCDNACVVDSSGNVTDSAGGHVWKKQVPTIGGQ